MIKLRLLDSTAQSAKSLGYKQVSAEGGKDGYVCYDPKFIKTFPFVEEKTDCLKTARNTKDAILLTSHGVVVARQSWVDMHC